MPLLPFMLSLFSIEVIDGINGRDSVRIEGAWQCDAEQIPAPSLSNFREHQNRL
jgi:hypothetical protein